MSCIVVPATFELGAGDLQCTVMIKNLSTQHCSLASF